MADQEIAILRDGIDEINRRLLDLIAERQDISVAIAAIKVAHDLPLYSEERETELLHQFRVDAIERNLDPDYVEELMHVVLTHSRAAQRKSVDDASGSES